MNQFLMEITEEDFETIDYINANSHIGIEFMKKLDDDIDVDTDMWHDSGYHEISNEGLAIGTGFYIPELEGKYIGLVTINSNDANSDILGVKNGDKYGDAIKKFEEHGFCFYQEDLATESVVYNKGRVAVKFYYECKHNEIKQESKIYDVQVLFLYLKNQNSNIDGDI